MEPDSPNSVDVGHSGSLNTADTKESATPLIIFRESTETDQVSSLETASNNPEDTTPCVKVYFDRTVEETAKKNTSSARPCIIIRLDGPSSKLTFEARKQLMVSVLSHLGAQHTEGMAGLVRELEKSDLSLYTPPATADDFLDNLASKHGRESQHGTEGLNESLSVTDKAKALLHCIATDNNEAVLANIRENKDILSFNTAESRAHVKNLSTNTAITVDIDINGNTTRTERIQCKHSHSQSADKKKAKRATWLYHTGPSLLVSEGALASVSFSHTVKFNSVSTITAMILMIGVAFIVKDLINTYTKSHLENNGITIANQSMINTTITTLSKPADDPTTPVQETVITSAPISAPTAKALATREEISFSSLGKKYRSVPKALIVMTLATAAILMVEMGVLSQNIDVPASNIHATEILLAILVTLLLYTASQRHTLSNDSKMNLGLQAAVGYREMSKVCVDNANLNDGQPARKKPKKPLLLYNGLMTPENGWFGKEEGLQQAKFEAERYGQYLVGENGACQCVFLSQGINKQSLGCFNSLKDRNYLGFVRRNQMAGILRLVLPLIDERSTTQITQCRRKNLCTKAREELSLIKKLAAKCNDPSNTGHFLRTVEKFEKIAEEQLSDPEVLKAICEHLEKQPNGESIAGHFNTLVAQAKQDAGDTDMKTVVAARALNQAANAKLGHRYGPGTFCAGSCKSTNDRTTLFYKAIARNFFGNKTSKANTLGFMGAWYDDGAKSGVDPAAKKAHKSVKVNDKELKALQASMPNEPPDDNEPEGIDALNH